MTDSEPTVLDQLRQNRQLVLGTSLACGVVGLVPLPVVPDLFIATLRGWLLTHLARRNGVELPPSEARAVVLPGGLAVTDRATAAAASLLGLRSLRRMARVVLLLLRFEDVARTFLLGTYFDYYLRQHHQGQTLGPMQAAAVHEAANEALDSAHIDVLSALLSRIVGDLVAAGLAMPRALWSLVTAASQGQEQAVEPESVEDPEGLVARAVGLLEREMAATRRATVEAICEGFDRAWERASGQNLVVVD